MDIFHLISLIIVISAAFAYLNFRFLKLPASIGLMLMSLGLSLLVLLAGNFFPSIKQKIATEVLGINFSDLLLEGMLSFMLFAGAIHVKFADLKSEKLNILLLSTVSVLISTFVIGISAFYLFNFLGINVQLIHSLLFGALISPTDPIAVLSILKSAGVSRSLETKMAGESLFNDGVAVVVFITILQFALPNASITIFNVLLLFGQEALGGLILGLAIGWISFKLIASIDNYQVEVLITLAMVMGGYTLAHYLHVSGPLAMVVAGIITGNKSRDLGMSKITAEYVDKFWELIDEILNAILFVIMGLELLLIKSNATLIFASLLMVIISIITRYFSIIIPAFLVHLNEKINQKVLIILTWGGLRGGISIALALTIQPTMDKDIWVTATYIIVCFSILVQGLTVGKLAQRLK
ncbi:MAG: sodium:proton antiporter [Bacteroidetes bacterium]|nr:sodium:proton antiporter [Bacteroidota bacterium]MBK9800572.1 sodium:proton antiporter [Bacteroidota bacterium]MBP6413917.1 sodium:proton antiporter [Bacteroidia bacterium]